MKKYLIFVLISMVVMATVPAQAASVGSPQTEGQGKIATALEWSYIFNRDLGYKTATRPIGNDNYNPVNFRIVRGYDVVSKISYGIFDFMDVYIKLGVANYGFKGDVYLGDTQKVYEDLSARDSFLYGGGFKLAYELKKGWIVGCDAQYLASDHELDFRATNLTSGAISTARYIDCKIQEWHVAPYIAKKIAAFTPYLGARYSDLRMNQKNPNDPKRWDNLVFRATYNVGVFTGIDWNFSKSFKLNVEGRFVDETAISLGAAYRF
ncbi:MAG: hypothetical protein MUC39_04905 [Candidatus Omnitrophica bacterium]|jgi:outer membrane protein W|nr:hypothetical protein [Candidatus Omnitrophota bacterium]